jgi:crossover junction endodeoxyribonuclease RuvC
MRILAFDTSMTAPGVAVLEVKNRKAKITALSHTTTDSKTQSHALRAEIIEAWATMFLAQHAKKPFDVVIREDFNGMTSAQNYPVLAAWSGIERACEKFNVGPFVKWIEVHKNGRKKTMLGPSPSKVKLIVAGSGKADKDEVEAAVRKWTGYKGEFAKDDESDAVAIGLAYLIERKLIKGAE